MLNKLLEEHSEWDLKIKINKTKYMEFGRNEENIETESRRIESAKEYEYPAFIINMDGKDVTNKASKGKNTVKALHRIPWDKNLSRETKKN